MYKHLFFVLILFPSKMIMPMKLTITPLISSSVSHDRQDIILANDTTKKILRATFTGPGQLGQKIALSLVCKSWQTFCNEDNYIIDCIKIVKKFNTNMIKDLFSFHNYYGYFKAPSEKELIKITTSSLFDARYTYIVNNETSSLLIYSIEKKYYSLFETLLNHSYIIIRPIILEKIISAKNIRFIELLKKIPFPF